MHSDEKRFLVFIVFFTITSSTKSPHMHITELNINGHKSNHFDTLLSWAYSGMTMSIGITFIAFIIALIDNIYHIIS